MTELNYDELLEVNGGSTEDEGGDEIIDRGPICIKDGPFWRCEW